MHWSVIITKATFPSNSLYTIKHYNVRGEDSAINFFRESLNSKQFTSSKQIHTQNQQQKH